MTILRKKHLINERYNCVKIDAHGIQIRGTHVLYFWKLMTGVKCLGWLRIKIAKKTASTQLLIMLRQSYFMSPYNSYSLTHCDLNSVMSLIYCIRSKSLPFVDARLAAVGPDTCRRV